MTQKEFSLSDFVDLFLGHLSLFPSLSHFPILVSPCLSLTLPLSASLLPLSLLHTHLCLVQCVPDKVAREVVDYFHSVTVIHPPGRNRVIKAQYKELLVSLSRKQPLIDHFILLFQSVNQDMAVERSNRVCLRTPKECGAKISFNYFVTTKTGLQRCKDINAVKNS